MARRRSKYLTFHAKFCIFVQVSRDILHEGSGRSSFFGHTTPLLEDEYGYFFDLNESF